MPIALSLCCALDRSEGAKEKPKCDLSSNSVDGAMWVHLEQFHDAGDISVVSPPSFTNKLSLSDQKHYSGNRNDITQAPALLEGSAIYVMGCFYTLSANADPPSQRADGTP